MGEVQQKLRHIEKENHVMFCIRTSSDAERKMLGSILQRFRFIWIDNEPVRQGDRIFECCQWIFPADVSYTSENDDLANDGAEEDTSVLRLREITIPQFLRFCKDTTARGL